MRFYLGAWLEIVRPVNALMTGIGVAIGYFLASRGFPITENLGLAMLSAMIIASGGMIINDYFDRHIDARIKPDRPIPSGKIRAWIAFLVSLLFFGIGIYLAKLVNLHCLAIASFASAILLVYSWSLARIPLLGNLAIALNTGLTFVYGEAAATNSIFSLNVSVLFILAFLSTLAREIYKDLEDVEGDKISRKTLPMVVGENWSRFLGGLAVMLSVVASPIPYLLGTLNQRYMILVGLVDIVFTYIAFSTILRGKLYSTEMKMAQLLALVAFLLGM